MNNRIVVWLVMGLALVGCKRELTPVVADESKFGIESFEFTYLTSKAKFKYEDGEQKLAVTANFRIKRDSAIWISLSPGLGIEAARVLVDQSSVQVLDKINRAYFSYDYAALSKQYGVQVTFQLAQAVILGNVLFEPERRREIASDKRFYYFTKEDKGFGITHFIGKKSSKLERLQAYQLQSNNSIVVNYTDFHPLGEQLAAHKVHARVTFDEKSKEDAIIDIEHSKMLPQNEPLTFPFNVPDKYTKK